jgi:NADPH2:quinone reductase
MPTPAPAVHQVAVEVRAAALNFPDLLMIRGRYQSKPPVPFVPGMEFAGAITSLGAEVPGLHTGELVFGWMPHGALAEQIVVDAAQVRPIPRGMTVEQAAGFSVTYQTSYYALAIAGKLAPGETALILGAAGGVGLAAVEIALALGARVIAGASSDEKLAVCSAAGASAVINYQKEDLRSRVKQLTHDTGCDLVYDPLGGPYTEAALRALAWRGRYLVIGFAAGEIPRPPLNLVLLGEATVRGVIWGEARRREPQTLSLVEEKLGQLFVQKRIAPRVSHLLKFDQAREALQLLADRAAIGKVVLVP